jgi:macrodomain Ter protein organizer (MatP/YcbG family)
MEIDPQNETESHMDYIMYRYTVTPKSGKKESRYVEADSVQEAVDEALQLSSTAQKVHVDSFVEVWNPYFDE